TVMQGAATRETFDNLTIANVENRINGVSAYIDVRNLNSPTAPANNRPAAAVGVVLPAPMPLSFFALDNGDDGLGDGFLFRDGAGTPAPSLLVNAFRDGVKVAVENATSGSSKFKLTVLVNEVLTETFDELVLDTIEASINGTSQFIEVTRKGNTRPANLAATEVATGL